MAKTKTKNEKIEKEAKAFFEGKKSFEKLSEEVQDFIGQVEDAYSASQEGEKAEEKHSQFFSIIEDNFSGDEVLEVIEEEEDSYGIDEEEILKDIVDQRHEVIEPETDIVDETMIEEIEEDVTNFSVEALLEAEEKKAKEKKKEKTIKNKVRKKVTKEKVDKYDEVMTVQGLTYKELKEIGNSRERWLEGYNSFAPNSGSWWIYEGLEKAVSEGKIDTKTTFREALEIKEIEELFEEKKKEYGFGSSFLFRMKVLFGNWKRSSNLSPIRKDYKMAAEELKKVTVK